MNTMVMVNSFAVFGDREQWINNLSVNLRQHFTLYTDSSWQVWVYTDSELRDTGYGAVLKKLEKEGLVKIIVVDNNNRPHQKRAKCMMMLWRVLPIWSDTEYVFCRDLDSILTPRQLQCVRSFISSGKIAHGINDNAGHCIPLMGGMCGFRSKQFKDLFSNQSLDELLNGSGINWDAHGGDQHFLMNNIWPYVSSSSLIHSLRGPNCRSDIKTVTDADISDIPAKVREMGDNFTNYIGAVGTATDRRGHFSLKAIAEFYNEYGNRDKCDIITKIEKDNGVIIL